MSVSESVGQTVCDLLQFYTQSKQMLGTLGRGEPWFVRDRMTAEWATGRFDLQTARFEQVNLGVRSWWRPDNYYGWVTGWIQDTRMCTEAVLVGSCMRRHTPVRAGPGRYIHNQGLVANNTCSTFNGVNLPTAQ